MNDIKNVKQIDFSALPVGSKFFQSRQSAVEGSTVCTKLLSSKTESGAWVNFKGLLSLGLVKYDARVWIVK